MGAIEQVKNDADERERRAAARRLGERMLVAGVGLVSISVGLWDYRAGLAVLGAFLSIGGLMGMRNHVS